MKKTFIIFAVLFSVTIFARDKVILHSLGTHPGSHPSAVLTVTTNGDEIDIKCDSVISNVDVVIKDQYGTVMHQSTQTVGPDETIIYVPSMDGDSEKTTIDLYYDRKHLCGFFGRTSKNLCYI